MPTRNVVLTAHQEKLIESLVQSGRYQNASEVMREGLRLIENREVEESAKIEALRAATQIGVASLDRGEFKEFADVSSLIFYLNSIASKIIAPAGNE